MRLDGRNSFQQTIRPKNVGIKLLVIRILDYHARVVEDLSKTTVNKIEFADATANTGDAIDADPWQQKGGN
jgi:hypothetical protein